MEMQQSNSAFENIRLDKSYFLIKTNNQKVLPPKKEEKNNPNPKQVMDLLEEGKSFPWKIFLSVVRPESSQYIQYNSFHIQEGEPRNKNYYSNTLLCMRFHSRQVS